MSGECPDCGWGNPCVCGEYSRRKPKEQSSLAPAAGSAASLQSEIAALKDDWAKRWWHDQPNNGDLQKVIVLLDKLADVTERIEKQMPPNS